MPPWNIGYGLNQFARAGLGWWPVSLRQVARYIQNGSLQFPLALRHPMQQSLALLLRPSTLRKVPKQGHLGQRRQTNVLWLWISSKCLQGKWGIWSHQDDGAPGCGTAKKTTCKLLNLSVYCCTKQSKKHLYSGIQGVGFFLSIHVLNPCKCWAAINYACRWHLCIFAFSA